MKIGHYQKCFQCDEVRKVVLMLGEGEEESSICEPCINNYLEGKIKFADAIDVTDDSLPEVIGTTEQLSPKDGGRIKSFRVKKGVR